MISSALIINRASIVGRKISLPHYKPTVNDWVVYGAALAIGRNTMAKRFYTKWLIDNKLNSVPGDTRELALKIFELWSDVTPLAEDDYPIKDISDPYELRDALKAIKRKRGCGDKQTNVYDVIALSVNGVSIADALDVIELVTRAASLSENDAVTKILIDVVDKLSFAVIAATEDSVRH